jgi:hypothetical protein
MYFGEGHDWHDIAEFDWPTVRPDVEAASTADSDPLPTPDFDLGLAASGELTGTVATALAWSALSADGFERLLFNLLNDFSNHENVQWLTHTNAPDRGRDHHSTVYSTIPPGAPEWNVCWSKPNTGSANPSAQRTLTMQSLPLSCGSTDSACTYLRDIWRVY